MGRFDLVIFDCDGVLVDSERLAVDLEASIITALGWPITSAEVIERFVGRTEAYMQAEVEARIARPVDWEFEFERRYREVFDTQLRAVPGVVTLLSSIGVPVCVASNSTRETLAYKLELAGLAAFFADAAFSADQVAHPKPAPDLYEFAAKAMGADASRCAVIEDSPSGIDAGLAAGMAVFAYDTKMADRARLVRPGVVIFDAMDELEERLR